MSLEITQKNFESDIKKSKKPVVLKVYADWCGPCLQLAPIFEKIAQEHGDEYLFAKLNVDNEQEVAIALQVTSLPTIVFIKDGNVVGKELGYMSKDDLTAKIIEYLG